MQSGIYRITCTSNNKVYVGSSYDLDKRLNQHKWDLQGNRHGNTYLQNSWNFYGEESFIFEVLEYCDISVLLQREQYYLDQVFELGNTFNICITAGSNLGTKLSQEHKENISKALKGRIHSQETRQKLSKALKGKKNSEKSKQLMRGRIVSEETRKKISESRKGITLSEDHKRKIGESGKGRKLPKTQEHRDKISNTLKGRKLSEETKLKMSLARRLRESK